MIIRRVKKFLLKLGIQHHLSLRRLRLIDKLLLGKILIPSSTTKTILDIGCNIGKDLITLLNDRDDLFIVGLDLKDYGLRQNNFQMVIGDANHLPFELSSFDVSTSIGVFEHIVPVEDLANAVKEIVRVSKSFAVVIPSIVTPLEPHISRIFWQLGDRKRKEKYPGSLLHMSDEAWVSFKGFITANTYRYWHIPFIINNLIIYKNGYPKEDPQLKV